MRIDAVVDRDLRGVAGTIRVTSDVPFALVDPLATLPLPRDDQTRIRTYPGRVERGVVDYWTIDEHTWGFVTLLPRRWEDLGATARHGLFANGAWYPQPLFRGRIKVVEWDVRLGLPDGCAGAVGDVAGTGELRWRGRGERASIAALPRGVVTPIREDGVAIDLVTRGRPRHSLQRELATEVSRARPEGASWRGTVVEAPLRRRLARPGVELAYVSDRAFRVSPPFRRFHRVAVTRAAIAAMIEVELPDWRDLAAAALADRYARTLAGLPAARLLRFGAFSPQIEAVLYDQRLPFWADVLERPHLSDPLSDDLIERFDPHEPGAATIAMLGDLEGPDAVDALWRSLTARGPAWQTFAEVGLTSHLDVLDRPPTIAHDVVLTVDRAAGTVTIARDDVDGPREPVVIDVDGDRDVFLLGPGDQVVRPAPGARRVVVDPDAHLRLTSRVGDRWPERFDATVAAGIWSLDPADRTLQADVQVTARRTSDTRVRWIADLYADRRTLPGLQVGGAVQFGRPIDGLRRVHRVAVGVGPALLDPRYLPVDVDHRVALGGGVAWRYDTRDEAIFPLHGVRLAAGVDGGLIPGTASTWQAAKATAIGVASPHLRWAFAGEVGGGLARGDVDHRLLALGGDGGLLSVGEAAAIGTRRAVARGEVRWAPVRGASIPLGVLWLADVQLSAGAETGLVTTPTGTASALGATAGIGFVGDWFGVAPEMIAASAGWPLLCDAVECDRSGVPEWTVRFAQAF